MILFLRIREQKAKNAYTETSGKGSDGYLQGYILPLRLFRLINGAARTSLFYSWISRTFLRSKEGQDLAMPCFSVG